MLFISFCLLVFLLPSVFSRYRSANTIANAGETPDWVWIVIGVVLGVIVLLVCAGLAFMYYRASRRYISLHGIKGHTIQGSDGKLYYNNGTGEYYDETGLRHMVVDTNRFQYYGDSPFTEPYCNVNGEVLTGLAYPGGYSDGRSIFEYA